MALIDVMQPIAFEDARASPSGGSTGAKGTCRRPEVKGLNLMVNSSYNAWRFENVWLDK